MLKKKKVTSKAVLSLVRKGIGERIKRRAVKERRNIKRLSEVTFLGGEQYEAVDS